MGESGQSSDAHVAAVIIDAMRQVASADGAIHEREHWLIDQLRDEVPGVDAIVADGVLLSDPQHREALLQSVVRTALADGGVSDVERGVIHAVCGRHGIDAAAVDAALRQAALAFLSALRGVSVYRADVVGIAARMGLTEADVDEVLRAEG